MALPTDNKFFNAGNPNINPPPGKVALGSALDANFAACAPIVNPTNYPPNSTQAQNVALVATSNGAAAVNLSNVNWAGLPQSVLLQIAQALVNSGAASAAGFIIN